jgi:hypothetical protein
MTATLTKEWSETAELPAKFQVRFMFGQKAN